MSDMAIKYAMKKKAKKMCADGGMMMEPEADETPKEDGYKNFDKEKGKEISDSFVSGYADGGRVGKARHGTSSVVSHEKGVHEPIMRSDPGTSIAGAHHGKYGNNQETSKRIHKEKLDEMRSMPRPHGEYAEGGEVGKDDDDLVMTIMKKRYSKGGQVSNDVGEGQDVDKMANQFDDLVLDDDLSADYTGENSGDEIGNEQEDDDRKDVVSQIMKSRKKKDRLPNPR